MKPTTVFRFERDDPFQAKLEDAIKALRYGMRNRFIVNICRAALDNMSKEQMVERMTEICHQAPSFIPAPSVTDKLEAAPEPAPTRAETLRTAKPAVEKEPSLLMLGV